MKIRVYESTNVEKLQEEVNAFIAIGIEVLNIQHSSSSVVTQSNNRQKVITVHTIVVSYA